MTEREASRGAHLTPEALQRIDSASEFIESLPLQTREWLLNMRDEDVETAKEGLELIRSLKATGRVLKWVFLTFAGAVIAVAAFGKALLEVLAWVRVK